MKHLSSKILLIIILMSTSIISMNAENSNAKIVQFGDMNNWIVKVIKESYVLGGETKYIYSVGVGDTITDPLKTFSSDSPWASSSANAKIAGITKASVTVFPEYRDNKNGNCARLETHMEIAKVFGIINIKVLACGSIFWGVMIDPITDTNNPMSKLIDGIPFTSRPKTLVYDYKVVTGGPCIRQGGKQKQGKLPYNDAADVHILLQHRWEDKDGNVYAHRIATGWERLTETSLGWNNAHQLKIHYGDISQKSYFQPYMKLRNSDRDFLYTRNSKGQMVPIHEVGWGSSDESVTHAILQMTSSLGEPYVGNINSKLWIDNIKLEY